MSNEVYARVRMKSKSLEQGTVNLYPLMDHTLDEQGETTENFEFLYQSARVKHLTKQLDDLREALEAVLPKVPDRGTQRFLLAALTHSRRP